METGSSYPYRGEKEQIVLVPMLLKFGTAVSHIPEISAFVGNPAFYVYAGDSRNISSALPDWSPCPSLVPNSRDLVLNVLVE